MYTTSWPFNSRLRNGNQHRDIITKEDLRLKYTEILCSEIVPLRHSLILLQPCSSRSLWLCLFENLYYSKRQNMYIAENVDTQKEKARRHPKFFLPGDIHCKPLGALLSRSFDLRVHLYPLRCDSSLHT